MDDARCFAFHRTIGRWRSIPALDWSAWDVQSDPVDRRRPRARQRRRCRAGIRQGRRDVQQQRPLPQVRCGHDVPELSRHARREASTRGRANTLRLALSGQLGDDSRRRSRARGARPLRQLQGLPARMSDGVDMARMKIEFLHHWRSARLAAAGPSDRLRCRAGRRGCARAVAREPAQSRARARARSAERLLGHLGAAHAAALAPRTFLARTRVATTRLRREANVVLFVDTFTNYFEPENAHAALRGAAAPPVTASRGARARRRVARPLCCGRTFLAAGLVDEARHEARAHARGARAARRARRRRSSASSRRVCCRCATNSWSLRPRRDARRLAARALLIEEFLAREARAGRFDAAARAAAAEARAAARPLPPEGVRRDGADASRAARWFPELAVDVDRVELLRHGRQLRLRGANTTTYRCRWRSSRCCPRCARPTPTR